MVTLSQRRCTQGAQNLIVLVVLMALWGAGCEKEEAPLPVRPLPVMKVGDVSGLINNTFPGRAKATEEVNLAFRVGGPLVERPVNVGDFVQKGDIIAKIDPRDFESRVGTLSGNLKQEQAKLKAMRVARPEDIGRLEAGLAAAKAELLKARADFGRAEPVCVGQKAPIR